MSAKPLEHEKIDVAGIRASEPYGFQTKEALDQKRHFYVNRKQDRFTLSARYCETGTTPQGKIWRKWRTLFSFSATLRQPESASSANLNIFYGGVVYGVKRTTVINVTRNTALVLNNWPTPLIEIAFDEIKDLYARNGKTIPDDVDELIESVGRRENYNTIITSLAYPLYSSTKLGQEFPTIPSSVTQLFRAETVKDFCDYLKISQDSSLSAYVENNFSLLTKETLFMLMSTIGNLDDENRFALVNHIQANTKDKVIKVANEKAFFTPVDSSWYLNEHTATLRGVLRKASKDTTLALFQSDFNEKDFSDLKIVLNKLKTNKKLSVKVSLKGEEPKNITEFVKVLKSKVNAIHEDASSVQHWEILKRLSELCDDKYLSFDNEGNLKIEVGQHKYPVVIKQNKFSSAFSTGPHLNQLNKKGDLWGIIRRTKYMPFTNTVNERKPRIFDENNPKVVFETTAYLDLLNRLEQHAFETLTKHKMPITKENAALVIATVFAYNNFALQKAKGVVPRKYFSLIKLGIDPELVFLFLEHRVSIENAKTLHTLPKQWIYNTLGINAKARQFDTSFF